MMENVTTRAPKKWFELEAGPRASKTAGAAISQIPKVLVRTRCHGIVETLCGVNCETVISAFWGLNRLNWICGGSRAGG